MKISNLNILHPNEVQNQTDKATLEKQRYFEFQHQLASGEIRDVEVYSGPIIDEGRTLLYSVVNDVTDRNKMEISLKRSNAQLESLIRAIPEIVFFKIQKVFIS